MYVPKRSHKISKFTFLVIFSFCEHKTPPLSGVAPSLYFATDTTYVSHLLSLQLRLLLLFVLYVLFCSSDVVFVDVSLFTERVILALAAVLLVLAPNGVSTLSLGCLSLLTIRWYGALVCLLPFTLSATHFIICVTIPSDLSYPPLVVATTQSPICMHFPFLSDVPRNSECTSCSLFFSKRCLSVSSFLDVNSVGFCWTSLISLSTYFCNAQKDTPFKYNWNQPKFRYHENQISQQGNQ